MSVWKIIGAAALGLSLASVAGAERRGPPEPFLPVLPRTTSEAARVAEVTGSPHDFTAPQRFEAKPGGISTAREAGTQPLAQISPAVPPEDGLAFELGRALFEKLWVAAPSSTRGSDGLGPHYNARSCAGCHPGNGRGQPPDGSGALSGFVVQLSVQGSDGPAPAPLLGWQLHTRSVPGLAPEGQITLRWQTHRIALNGEAPAELRQPHVTLTGATLPKDLRMSPRVAPPLIGMGLIEAVPEASIRALADPQDADGDGISGRVAEVPSVAFGGTRLGRFGPKAAQPSLRDMVGQAMLTDMGLSSPDFPDPAGDCTAAQIACRAAPHGEEAGLRDGREVSGAARDALVNYVAHLALPPRKTVRDVLPGKAQFHAAGCAACHQPAFVTERLKGDPARSFQLIWPYSDLLLHDMGDGLADDRPEGNASGREWRTAPLWGLGRNSTGRYLHDGRARSPLEAILWHGGEARASRDRVIAMEPGARAELIEFLESL